VVTDTTSRGPVRGIRRVEIIRYTWPRVQPTRTRNF